MLSNTVIEFRPEFLDFRRGIWVGNLEDNERITRILKLALEERYGESFVTERWGRGVFWRWIGLLPRANRTAKPISSHVSFGCSKFFVMLDTDEQLFECGMQVERGYVKAPPEYQRWELRPDWDWHRLLKSLKVKSPMERELKRLLREGFLLFGGSWEEEAFCFSHEDLPSLTKLRQILQAAPEDQWVGFQVYYAMDEREVQSATGVDLIESMLAMFEEVRPVMNLCMDIQLQEGTLSDRLEPDSIRE
ncbi:hypothetical protein MYX75_06985 [Acidobacteria bacterium AH-259-A15]|nr:hypothetical protein [Acidobacteria bacterium AH-259-A15]